MTFGKPSQPVPLARHGGGIFGKHVASKTNSSSLSLLNIVQSVDSVSGLIQHVTSLFSSLLLLHTSCVAVFYTQIFNLFMRRKSTPPK